MLYSGADIRAHLNPSPTPGSRSTAVPSTHHPWAQGGHCGGGRRRASTLVLLTARLCVPETHRAWNHSPPPRQHAIRW